MNKLKKNRKKYTDIYEERQGKARLGQTWQGICYGENRIRLISQTERTNPFEIMIKLYTQFGLGEARWIRSISFRCFLSSVRWLDPFLKCAQLETYNCFIVIKSTKLQTCLIFYFVQPPLSTSSSSLLVLSKLHKIYYIFFVAFGSIWNRHLPGVLFFFFQRTNRKKRKMSFARFAYRSCRLLALVEN